ncbi:MAG: alpha/beta hydrolase [Betaproteobacteria bacterium]|nr:alpha/beta hydrolase [Betaproteobacteria bacterium]
MSSMWLDLLGCEYRLGYTQAGPIRTRYLEAGFGGRETIVFLHGSGGYLEAYLRNIAPHAERYRVFAIDMIGHGYSDKPDHPYEPEHYVGHLVDFMDAMGLERVHVSGESLGGWVAERMAVTHPHRVGKIILNTAAGVHYDPEVSNRIHSLSLKAARDPNKENIRKRLEWLMLDPKVVTDEMVEMRYKVYTQPGFAKTMENIMCLHTAEFRLRNLMTEAELARVQAPTLVLWTTHDPGSSVEIGRQLARGIKGSRFVVMDRCGHWPQFEDANTFNRLELEFLAS